MLAGIGVIIILKQILHAFGMMLILKEISLLFKVMVAISSLFEVFNHIQLGSVVITVVSLILIAWDKVPFKEIKINSRCINSSNFRHCAE
jgi:MFS superfamily sulfate permease-like transporter